MDPLTQQIILSQINKGISELSEGTQARVEIFTEFLRVLQAAHPTEIHHAILLVLASES